MFTSLTAVPVPEKEAVPLRIVTQFMDGRALVIKNIPTAKEQGINVVMPSDRGFAAPKNMPPAMQESLQRAIATSLKDPEFLKLASTYASVISYLPGADWQHMLNAGLPALEALARKMPKE